MRKSLIKHVPAEKIRKNKELISELTSKVGEIETEVFLFEDQKSIVLAEQAVKVQQEYERLEKELREKQEKDKDKLFKVKVHFLKDLFEITQENKKHENLLRRLHDVAARHDVASRLRIPEFKVYEHNNSKHQGTSQSIGFENWMVHEVQQDRLPAFVKLYLEHNEIEYNESKANQRLQELEKEEK